MQIGAEKAFSSLYSLENIFSAAKTQFYLLEILQLIHGKFTKIIEDFTLVSVVFIFNFFCCCYLQFTGKVQLIFHKLYVNILPQVNKFLGERVENTLIN